MVLCDQDNAALARVIVFLPVGPGSADKLYLCQHHADENKPRLMAIGATMRPCHQNDMHDDPEHLATLDELAEFMS